MGLVKRCQYLTAELVNRRCRTKVMFRPNVYIGNGHFCP